MSGVELVLLVGLLVLAALLVAQVVWIVGNSRKYGGLVRSWEALRHENEVDFDRTMLALHYRVRGASTLERASEPVIAQ